jgi:hypothetical protein
MNVMCHMWGPRLLVAPMTNCHVLLGKVQSAEVCCCYVAMWHLVLRWLCHGLPRGMLVGPTCQVNMVVGPTQLRWTNKRAPRGTSWLSWLNDELTRGTGVAAGFFLTCALSCLQIAPR